MIDWADRPAVVIATGPSLRPEDVEICRTTARIIAVNDASRLAPWADVLYACDPEWWDHHQGVTGFAGRRFTQDRGAAARWGLEHIESRPLPGLCLDPSAVHQGGNGGYQAVNLAYHFGARRILLLGFDMKPAPDGRRHFFGDHPGSLNRSSPYRRWIAKFDRLAQDLERAGVAVINCSRDTALECFRRSDIRAELGR